MYSRPKNSIDRISRVHIDGGGSLAYGTAEQTEQVCRETLETMMKVRGYHFAPAHAIRDNTPVENVIAMYNAAHKYWTYEP